LHYTLTATEIDAAFGPLTAHEKLPLDYLRLADYTAKNGCSAAQFANFKNHFRRNYPH